MKNLSRFHAATVCIGLFLCISSLVLAEPNPTTPLPLESFDSGPESIQKGKEDLKMSDRSVYFSETVSLADGETYDVELWMPTVIAYPRLDDPPAEIVVNRGSTGFQASLPCEIGLATHCRVVPQNDGFLVVVRSTWSSYGYFDLFTFFKVDASGNPSLAGRFLPVSEAVRLVFWQQRSRGVSFGETNVHENVIGIFGSLSYAGRHFEYEVSPIPYPGKVVPYEPYSLDFSGRINGEACEDARFMIPADHLVSGVWSYVYGDDFFIVLVARDPLRSSEPSEIYSRKSQMFIIGVNKDGSSSLLQTDSSVMDKNTHLWTDLWKEVP